MNEINNIWFLFKAGFIPEKKRHLRETAFLGLKLYGIMIVLKVICFGITYALDYYGIFEIPEHITSKKLSSYSPIIKALMIVIIAPIIEELTYRSGLIFSKQNLLIALFGISYLISKNALELDRISSLMTATILGIVLHFSLNQKKNDILSKLWTNNRRKIFYGLLLSFSLAHLANYELTKELLLFSPIIILSHLTSGFIYSYARLSSGIFLAIFIHSFNNGISFLIGIILE